MRRDFLSILDLDSHDLVGLLDDSARMKKERGGEAERRTLAGKCLAMVFEKASTRTRVSFEVGMEELGGHAIFLNPKDLQLGRGEEIRDMARVLSRYVAGVMIRAFAHRTIEEFARHSSVPVVNGLSDREHPCQILGDLLTLREHFGHTDGLRVGWIGDGNNVCTSLILASAMAGLELTVASPGRYRPEMRIVEAARSAGAKVVLTGDPREAARDANALYTDVWVSMGEEAEREERLAAFRGYTIDAGLLSLASPDAVVLHCLPAHRGEEITDGVIEGPQSIVWDQAENRLHTEKALLAVLLRPGAP
jgi:ornithine carbamoyltransferase